MTWKNSWQQIEIYLVAVVGMGLTLLFPLTVNSLDSKLQSEWQSNLNHHRHFGLNIPFGPPFFKLNPDLNVPFERPDFGFDLGSQGAINTLIWQPGSSDYAALNNQVWEYLAQVECPRPIWQPDFTSLTNYQASTSPLRQQLWGRTGSLSQTPAGNLLKSQQLYANERYTIDWVRVSSRLQGVSVFGYLARPLGLSEPSPAVILLHATGVPPHTAFGWRLIGDDPYFRYAYAPPLEAVAVDLVESGYTVFVPYLSDYDVYWPNFSWFDIDRLGTILGKKIGSGGGYGLLVPQVKAGIDFLVQDPQVIGNQIALMGWNLGARVAGVTSALDERVAATVLLAPTQNSRSLRSDPILIRYDAAFGMLDCSFGQVEIAALIAPRPLLFSYSLEDPYGLWYVSDQTFTDIVQLYTNLGASDKISRTIGQDQYTAVSQQPLQWLNHIFDYNPRPLPGGEYLPPAPNDWPYPETYYDLEYSEIANNLASLGPCPPLSMQIDYTSLTAFQKSVEPLRSQVIAELIGTIPPEQAIVILERRTVLDDPKYLLEWVRFRARFTDIEIAGYLATPTNYQSPLPAVLSLDGNYRLGYVFGLEYEGFPYLNAYGDFLARSGYIVFAPYMPSPYADGWGAILIAKTASARNIWNYLLPFYMSCVDFLVEQLNVDPNRVAAYGISYAGVAALYTAAIDQRISTLVYSNPMVNMDTFFSDPYSAYSPIWQTLLCSNLNLVQQFLIAPRHFIWENGIYDNNRFQEYDLEPLDKLQMVYDELGYSDRVRFFRHDGGHETRPQTWGFNIFDTDPPRYSNRCDFNNDGNIDILWRNPTTGQNYVWLMNGTVFSRSVALMSQGGPWQIVGTGDFNNDGKTDILWRNQTTGQNYVWLMDGTVFSRSVALMSQGGSWQIVGTGDFNNDGKTDILWRNPTTGQNYVWLMDGTVFSRSVALMSQGGSWQIVGTGDFNNDGKTDILWRNPTTGQNYVWLMNGTVFSSALPLFAQSGSWEIVGPK